MENPNCKKRGERFKQFRNSKLNMTQKELSETLDISQSVFSEIEKNGRVPSPEIIEYCAEKGLNIHWYYTGEGPMIYKPEFNSVVNAKKEYKAIKKRIEFEMSDHPLDAFLTSMDKLKEIRLKMIRNTSISNDEIEKLMGSISKNIKAKSLIL